MEEDEAGPMPSTSGYSSSRLRGRTEVGADEVGIRPRATAGTSRDANSGPEKGKWYSRNFRASLALNCSVEHYSSKGV